MYKDHFKFTDKKVSGKIKEEIGEKKHDIDKRLDVGGQLSSKKGKKGNLLKQICLVICMYIHIMYGWFWTTIIKKNYYLQYTCSEIIMFAK